MTYTLSLPNWSRNFKNWSRNRWIRSAIFQVKLLSSFDSIELPWTFSERTLFTGEHLKCLRYEHPFEQGKSCPLVSATYIRGDTGTGLVHTAPAHGPDDFVTGLKNGLPLVSKIRHCQWNIWWPVDCTFFSDEGMHGGRSWLLYTRRRRIGWRQYWWRYSLNFAKIARTNCTRRRLYSQLPVRLADQETSDYTLQSSVVHQYRDFERESHRTYLVVILPHPNLDSRLMWECSELFRTRHHRAWAPHEQTAFLTESSTFLVYFATTCLGRAYTRLLRSHHCWGLYQRVISIEHE